jgi:hypothetical protein
MHDVTPDLGAYLTATGPGKPQDGLGVITAPAGEMAASGDRK